ncbi:hypothetical protein P691DRAFT_783164 [Macrolepiota fuliginosa MF-IS2]|uniref:Uncharacterized protein n=1 Tax=Macrolepiota fuliginosa MF-IS2 TaxID=1400762 RepID=A0A9P5WYN2_9AGAR|nr:hypothetical protein P691DRAFT_783164 [Macrolepiota fuliginosa MF-IS2]
MFASGLSLEWLELVLDLGHSRLVWEDMPNSSSIGKWKNIIIKPAGMMKSSLEGTDNVLNTGSDLWLGLLVFNNNWVISIISWSAFLALTMTAIGANVAGRESAHLHFFKLGPILDELELSKGVEGVEGWEKVKELREWVEKKAVKGCRNADHAGIC